MMADFLGEDPNTMIHIADKMINKAILDITHDGSLRHMVGNELIRLWNNLTESDLKDILFICNHVSFRDRND